MRHASDQNTRLGWTEPAQLKLMGFDLSDFRIYFNLINLGLNWVHFSEKFLRAQLISSGSNLSAGSNLMRDFFWVLNCYICLFKITNSKSKEKPLANCINALQRKHILSRSITGTVCIILKKKIKLMCDSRTVIMLFRYHWKFSRKVCVLKTNALYWTEVVQNSEHNAFGKWQV